MTKLSKRRFPALYDKETGKWYTGYSQDYHMDVNTSDEHTTRYLELQYDGYSRGRSAANIHFVDSDGYRYMMSMSGFDLLLSLTDLPYKIQREKGWISEWLGSADKYDIKRCTNLNGKGVWFTGTFWQTKQGQNYFIEPAVVGGA